MTARHAEKTGVEGVGGAALSEVSAALMRLQRAVRGLVRRLPVHPTRAPELQQMLGIDRGLAWKVHRLMHARTPAEAAAFVPGAGAMEILCTAAGVAGAGGAEIAAVREAFAGDDRAAETHVGDRRSARLMLTSEDPGGEGRAELGLRRSAYEAGAFLAGLRARAHLQTYIVSPGSEGRADMIALRGMYDLERLRV